MRGEYVIVRTYGGRPLIRRVRAVGENVIYITNDQQLKLLMEDAGDAIGPIGFPKEDVFRYDPKMLELINNTQNITWDKLKPFNC